MLAKLGYVPEKSNEVHLIPVVSPGKNTPVVATFLNNESKRNNFPMKEILETTLNLEKTMTEKVQNLNENYFYHVRTIAWFSNTFTQGQVMRYTSMEKEFLALLLAVLHFREYLESFPLTYVLSNSQSLLWVLNSQGENIKINTSHYKIV